jgi:glycosyltransferase involved in cell wall biosynthesis
MSSIDIVVPCYNYGRFLRCCVESVLEQSHRELRVLIIDDCSSDDTPAIAGELAERDLRVQFRRHNVNHGHIATYNEGIEWAAGDYFLLLSADDFLLAGALARAVAVFDARPEVGLVWGATVLYRDGEPLPGESAGAKNGGARMLDPMAFIRTLAHGNCVPQSSAMVRTSLQKQLGGYRSELPHAGDLELWLRFALHSSVVRLAATQSAYRLHDENMSRGYRGVDDFEQCRNAFRMQYDAIRARLPGGTELEAWIRRRYAFMGLIWAKTARRLGEHEVCQRLLMEALEDVPGYAVKSTRENLPINQIRQR